MKVKYTLLLLIGFILCFTTRGFAQNKTIEGTVNDAQTGKPLSGVNILVKGTSTGTATDSRGHYSLSVSSLQDTLRFSYIGYQTETVPVDGRATINISMKLKVLPGQQLVVVGFGKKKKSNLTGAITSVSIDSLTEGVVTSVDNLISGNLPGVQVVRNSAAPGGGVSVSIRGASSITAGSAPLYIIDGLPIPSSPAITGAGKQFPAARTKSNILSSINPNDIKSISVLKGPSATAIYGARGSNGVVLITTKNGTRGNMQIQYSGYGGIQNVAHHLHLLNAQQYKTILNNIISEGGGSAPEKVTTIANNGSGTNWQKEVTSKNAVVQNHQLSFSGGSRTTTYRISLNYLNQNGVVLNSNFKRYGGRINLTSHLSDKFDVGFKLSTNYSRNHEPPIQSYNVNQDAGVLYAAYNMDPTLPIRNKSGDYFISPFLNMDNPLALAKDAFSLQKTYRTFGDIFGKYSISPQLSVKLKIGGNLLNQDKNVFLGRQTLQGGSAGGIGTIFHGRDTNYLLEGTVRYQKSFQNQTLKILGGVSTQKYINYNINMHANGFPADVLKTYNIGLGDPTNFGIYSHKASHKLLSYLGRINYSLFNKYLLTATLRVDGSSRFGANNKFGYFPSVALAWKLKQERFLRNVRAISSLKLHASWGQSGNDRIGNYAAISTFSAGPGAIFDGQQVSSTVPARLANPNLKWETSQETDIGIDYGFLNNRITGSVDYYHKKTFNMLVNLPVPTSSGFSTKLSNVGSMVNTGIDFGLTSRNVTNSNFAWTTNVNISTVSNKVKSLGGLQSIISGGAGFSGNLFITEPGQPLFSYYGYKVTGVWQKGDNYSATKDHVRPGDLKYLDVNGDSTITPADRIILGNSFPDFIWSVVNTFNYKNFQLKVRFKGVQGVSMYNNNLADNYFPLNFRRNKISKLYLNRWTPDNPSKKYPSFVHPLDEGKRAVNSYTVESASYLRLQLVRLGYTLRPSSNLINSVTFYVTGENLFTITNYVGVDPALNSNGTSVRRIDYNTYPSARTFILGINLNF